MRTRSWLPLLALGVGLAVLAAAPAPAADRADKPDAARIAKLVGQLGSDDFDDREKASAELNAIGEPALDALRQAAKSTDEEVHMRATALVAGIEKRLESVNALAPRRVHLVYKDTPVKEAVEDFARKSGYAVTLHDPENKLKDRTVTLDTGDVTFWQAFGQFCEKAGVKEGAAGDLAPNPAQPATGPATRPILPLRQNAAPGPQTAVPFAAPPPDTTPTPATPPGAAPGGPAVGAPAVPPNAGVGSNRRVPGAATDGITLVDGKPDALPTDASSAVRVQALSRADSSSPAPDGELQIALRLSLEPKLQWQGVDKVTVAKAIDDQRQQLAQAATDATPAGVPPAAVLAPGAGFIAAPLPALGVAPDQGGTRQDVLVRLKKGEKAAKSLTELSGIVTATLLGEIKPVITATDILKAGGKVFKGGDNGQIKVVDASFNERNENGQITIRVELQPPTDVVPVGGNGPVGAIFRRPIRRVPLPAPAGGAGGVAAGVAIVIGPGFGPGMNGVNALTLEDDKGNPIRQTSTGTQVQVTNGVASMQYVLTFQAEKGQEASKLVYNGRKILNVQIPFTLKDVPLP